MSLNFRHISEVWTEACERMLNPAIGIPLSWWPIFNDLIGGLRPNELTLFCAPTGTGKTQWLANLCAQLFLAEVPVFAAPVETGDADFVIRVASALAEQDLNTGEPVHEIRLSALTEKYCRQIKEHPFFIANYDNRVDVDEMCDLLRYLHKQHGIKAAVLDNLNFFLKVTRAEDQIIIMDAAIHKFVMLMKEVPIHIFLVVHPKKTDGGRVLSEFDIKGSSTAVQEAHNVMLFNRPEEKSIKDGDYRWSDRELVFRKIRRRGFNVGKSIWMNYDNGIYQEYRQ